MKARRQIANLNLSNNIFSQDYRLLLDIDDANAFDYENGDKTKYSHEQVKQLLV